MCFLPSLVFIAGRKRKYPWNGKHKESRSLLCETEAQTACHCSTLLNEVGLNMQTVKEFSINRNMRGVTLTDESDIIPMSLRYTEKTEYHHETGKETFTFKYSRHHGCECGSH